MHRRRMILEKYDGGQDQSRCLILWMWTGDMILWGEPLQVPVHFAHHLVGFGVFKYTP